MNLLTVSDLAITYQDKYLFTNLNLSVASGERLIIIGESGCGKSSVLKAILGAINYDGEITTNSKISYMPQNLALLDHKTVRQNIELPGLLDRSIGIPEDELYQQFGLASHLDQYVSKLSGGERQRVALMRALVSGGNLLLFDEPLSKLDQLTKERMLAYFEQQITKQYGLLYVTHDLHEAVTLATKILVLSSEPQLIENNLAPELMVTKLKQMLGAK